MRISKIFLFTAFLFVALIFSGCQVSYQIQPIPVNPPVESKDGWSIFTCSENINDLFAEGDVLWLATDGGIERWQPSSNTYWKYTTLDGLAGNKVSCLFKDDKGNLWFGTDRGLTRYDGNTWRTFNTDDGLAVNQITGISQDKNGNLWVIYGGAFYPGTDVGYSPGVGRYDGVKWQTFTKKDGLASDGVRGIFYDSQGNTWFATDEGLNNILYCHRSIAPAKFFIFLSHRWADPSLYLPGSQLSC